MVDDLGGELNCGRGFVFAVDVVIAVQWLGDTGTRDGENKEVLVLAVAGVITA